MMNSIFTIRSVSTTIQACTTALIPPINSNNKNNNNKECYIDYQEGTIPIILSAPHGGTERPDHLPDRHASQGNLKGDRYTRELTLELADEIERILNVNINSYSTMNCSKQKLRVFRVSNRLHRSKVDVNRGALEQAVPIVTEKKNTSTPKYKYKSST
mmetsp:Transcript_13801/g.20476  ORF Transcript_13801/g.20476 Transcript_13801/m.20476 type:complete len:158 (-) Transcript_13801:141-614(-)